MKKVILLWAIPASGKTTYAKEIELSHRKSAAVIHIDKYKQKGDKLIKEVVDECTSRLNYYSTCILDGLITTNAVARKLFTAIKDDTKDVEFEIVWWTKDVIACKHNDRGRRQINSTITIENTPFEEPNEELLEEFKIKKCIRKEVMLKPDYRVWAGEHGLGDVDKLESDTWSLGGTSGNCWDDSKHSISPSPQPASFEAFDKLLEEICPDIKMLQYKKLYNSTVTVEDYSEGDYYGGSVSYGYYVCDLKKLHEMLKEMNLLQ